MIEPKIYSLIKTPCGRAKYAELLSREDFAGKIRLGWFVFFATIRDWNLPHPHQIDQSDS